MKWGYGIYRWPDNSIFQGDWVENMITGTGKYVWEDERIYVGEWF